MSLPGRLEVAQPGNRMGKELRSGSADPSDLPPRSAARFGLNLVALAGGLAAVLAASRRWPGDGLAAGLAGCAAIAVVIIADDGQLTVRQGFRP